MSTYTYVGAKLNAEPWGQVCIWRPSLKDAAKSASRTAPAKHTGHTFGNAHWRKVWRMLPLRNMRVTQAGSQPSTLQLYFHLAYGSVQISAGREKWPCHRGPERYTKGFSKSKLKYFLCPEQSICQDQLKNKIHLIRFGHTTKLPFFPPCRNWPMCMCERTEKLNQEQARKARRRRCDSYLQIWNYQWPADSLTDPLTDRGRC